MESHSEMTQQRVEVDWSHSENYTFMRVESYIVNQYSLCATVLYPPPSLIFSILKGGHIGLATATYYGQ